MDMRHMGQHLERPQHVQRDADRELHQQKLDPQRHGEGCYSASIRAGYMLRQIGDGYGM